MTSRLPTGFELPPQGRITQQQLLRLAQALVECGVSDVGGERGGTVMDGSQWSGTAKVVKGPPIFAVTPGDRNGIPSNVLSCKRVGSTPLGGMASVQVWVADGDAPAGEVIPVPNDRLVLDVKWQSGRGGGEAQVDISNGALFTVGAADTITASARIIPATYATFQPSSNKRVEATVSWGGAISAKTTLGTSEGLQGLAAAATTPIRIPSMAVGVMAVTTDPANYAGLLIEMSRDAAGTRAFGAFNPYGNMTPLVSGARFVSFTPVANATIIPVWELAL